MILQQVLINFFLSHAEKTKKQCLYSYLDT